jgi:hypothetical protein
MMLRPCLLPVRSEARSSGAYTASTEGVKLELHEEIKVEVSDDLGQRVDYVTSTGTPELCKRRRAGS